MQQKRVALYLRSPKKDPEELSRQQRVCTALAHENDWKIVACFEDNATSGNSLERGGLEALSTFVALGKCDLVLVESSTCISRVPILLQEIVRRFGLSGVALHTSYGQVRLAPLSSKSLWQPVK